MSYLSALIDLNTTDVKYSSFLLYGSSLNFEVFANNRDKLAQFNIILKNSNKAYLEIFDTSGKMIFGSEIGPFCQLKEQIPLTPGVLILKIKVGENIYHRKLVKL